MFDRTDKYSGRAHNCGGVIFCSTCRQKVEHGHDCSYKVPTEEEKTKKREAQKHAKYIVYDMETVTVESGEYNGKLSDNIQITLVYYRTCGKGAETSTQPDLCKSVLY